MRAFVNNFLDNKKSIKTNLELIKIKTKINDIKLNRFQLPPHEYEEKP